MSRERAKASPGIDDASGSAWPEELEAFYARERDRLVRFALVLSGDRAAAEDLVQEAFVRIYRFRRRAGTEGLSAYARRTILNLARSRFRRAARLRQHPSLSESRISDSNLEEHDRVWEALMELSARQRACVALRFYEDMSEQQIAGVLGVSVGSVKRHMGRGLQRLRQSLKEDEDATP